MNMHQHIYIYVIIDTNTCGLSVFSQYCKMSHVLPFLFDLSCDVVVMMRKPIACYFYVKNVFFSATCIGNESHGNDMSSMYFIYILKHE